MKINLTKKGTSGSDVAPIEMNQPMTVEAT